MSNKITLFPWMFTSCMLAGALGSPVRLSGSVSGPHERRCMHGHRKQRLAHSDESEHSSYTVTQYRPHLYANMATWRLNVHRPPLHSAATPARLEKHTWKRIRHQIQALAPRRGRQVAGPFGSGVGAHKQLVPAPPGAQTGHTADPLARDGPNAADGDATADMSTGGRGGSDAGAAANVGGDCGGNGGDGGGSGGSGGGGGAGPRKDTGGGPGPTEPSKYPLWLRVRAISRQQRGHRLPCPPRV